MKKKIILAMIIGLCITMIGCNKSQKPAMSSKNPVTMKIGHSFPTDTPRHESLLKFKELVEEKTKGNIIVEIYPSAQLGTEMEMLEGVKLGSVEGVRCGPFEDAAPELQIYTMPFLFSNMDEVHKVTRGAVTDKIIKNTEKNGIKVLAVGDVGEFRQFSNNVRPITTPADLKGLKMRTPPMDSIVQIMKTLEGNPVSIPFSETYMALKTGVADGEENPLTNIESMKFYEVQKYLSMVNYQYHAEMLYVNLEWFNSFDEDTQNILVESAKESMLLNDELLKEATKKSYEILASNMEVNELTPEQREAFIEKVQPVYDYYIKKGTFSQADIDEIRKVTKEN